MLGSYISTNGRKKSETLLANVAKACNNHSNTTTFRSSACLKCRWTIVQSLTQKYLVAQKLYRANIPSGENEDDTKANIMTLYRERNAKIDKAGQKKPAAPIKSVEAIDLLAKHPKFSNKVGGSSLCSPPTSVLIATSGRDSSPDSLDQGSASTARTEDVSTGQIGNIDVHRPSLSRPVGVKFQKAADAAEKAAYRMAKSIDGITRAINQSTKAKLMDSSMAIQYKIISSLSLPQEEQENAMRELLLKASSLETTDASNEERNEPTQPNLVRQNKHALNFLLMSCDAARTKSVGVAGRGTGRCRYRRSHTTASRQHL